MIWTIYEMTRDEETWKIMTKRQPDDDLSLEIEWVLLQTKIHEIEVRESQKRTLPEYSTSERGSEGSTQRLTIPRLGIARLASYKETLSVKNSLYKKLTVSLSPQQGVIFEVRDHVKEAVTYRAPESFGLLIHALAQEAREDASARERMIAPIQKSKALDRFVNEGGITTIHHDSSL